MSDYILPILTFLGTLGVGYLAYRGTRTTDKTDRLSKVATLYSDYAEKQERRADKLEKDVEELKISQRTSEEQQKATNDRLNDLENENEQYKSLITEVIHWITELLDWETHGYPEPAPRMTLTMILAHLTAALDQRPRTQRGDHDSRMRKARRGTR